MEKEINAKISEYEYLSLISSLILVGNILAVLNCWMIKLSTKNFFEKIKNCY